MSACKTCGREPENGTETHWLGCPETLRRHARNLVEPDFTAALEERERTPESECIKDGCTKSRAVSKGPRPTKYCDDHKTRSTK